MCFIRMTTAGKTEMKIIAKRYNWETLIGIYYQLK